VVFPQGAQAALGRDSLAPATVVRDTIARMWTRTTFDDRVLYSVILGFWIAIVGLLIAVYTGRWP